MSERDSTGGAGSGGSDAASPLTARSIRLERVAQVLAHSQEELRRYILNFQFIIILINFKVFYRFNNYKLYKNYKEAMNYYSLLYFMHNTNYE